MKVNSTIRPECGTEAGYKKHNRQNPKEIVCQPCRDAHNAWRRDYHARNPHKNIEHGSKYRNENRELVRARSRKYRTPLSEEQKLEAKLLKTAKAALHKAQKAQEKAEAAAARAAVKAEQKAAHEAQMAANAEARQIAVEAYRAEKKLKHDAEMEARRLDRERLKAEKDALKPAPLTEEQKLANKEARKQETHERRMARVVNHGTTLTQYKWCKYQNESACEPCRAVAAEYVREYCKANPDKVKTWATSNNQKSIKERLKPGAIQVYYSRESILKRDNYTCYICDEPVDLDAAHNMSQPGWELYPHLDHVIPLSKGGDDTPANVKTTHAKCNMAKMDNMPEMAL